MSDLATESHVSDLDMFSLEAVCDPQTNDALLRELAPAVYLERYDIWATGRHEHVYAAARDWETFSSTSRPFHDPTSIRPEILLTADPPEHPRVRAVIQRAISRPSSSGCGRTSSARPRRTWTACCAGPGPWSSSTGATTSRRRSS